MKKLFFDEKLVLEGRNLINQPNSCLSFTISFTLWPKYYLTNFLNVNSYFKILTICKIKIGFYFFQTDDIYSIKAKIFFCEPRSAYLHAEKMRRLGPEEALHKPLLTDQRDSVREVLLKKLDKLLRAVELLENVQGHEQGHGPRLVKVGEGDHHVAAPRPDVEVVQLHLILPKNKEVVYFKGCTSKYRFQHFF